MGDIDWKARIATAKARAEKAGISPEEKAEIDARAEEQKLLGEERAAKRERQELELARRFDVARAALGPKAKLTTLIVDADNAMVLAYAGAAAHSEWETDIATAAGDPKKRIEITQKYALATVRDWNGATGELLEIGAAGAALLMFAEEFPGACTAIVNLAVGLAGMATEERKS